MRRVPDGPGRDRSGALDRADHAGVRDGARTARRGSCSPPAGSAACTTTCRSTSGSSRSVPRRTRPTPSTSTFHCHSPTSATRRPCGTGRPSSRCSGAPGCSTSSECFIGPEIFSNPVQHVRIKVPESREPRDPVSGALKMGATSWHQDNGVVLPEADDTQMLTVWFPLRRAGVEHGCLQVVPGSHRRGLLDHCPGGPGGLQVPERVASRRARGPAPDGAGRRALLPQADVAQLAPEPERRDPDQLRPALQPDRPTDGAIRLPGLRRPEPPCSGDGADGCR